MDTDEPALADVLRRWCEANELSPAISDLRDKINLRMREQGLDLSLGFGPSYFMRPHLGEPAALRRLWRRELLPMLREHHYGNEEALRSYRFESWCIELGLTAPADGGESGDPPQ